MKVGGGSVSHLFMPPLGAYTHVVVPSSNFGKNYLPRVGAEIDVAPITDVVEIMGADTFVRPMYAGNALATVKAGGSVKLLSVRATAFDKAPESGGSAAVEPFAADGVSTGE